MPRTPHRIRALLGFLPAVVLAMAATLTGVHPALAQTPTQGPGAPSPIAGLWIVHHDPTNPAAADLAIFQNNGVMLTSEAPSTSPDPMDMQAGLGPSFSSQGYGVWQPNANGSIAFKFLEISYDQNGDYAGMATIHGTVTLDSNGNSATGSYTVTVTLPDGSSMDVAGAPLTATRVTVDSTP